MYNNEGGLHQSRVAWDWDGTNNLATCHQGPLHTWAKGCGHSLVSVSWGSLILIERPYHWHGFGGGPNANFGRPWHVICHLSCTNLCRIFIHDNLFRPLGLHLLVWSELGQSWPFQPMNGLRKQWSRAFNLMCEMALSYTWLWIDMATINN